MDPQQIFKPLADRKKIQIQTCKNDQKFIMNCCSIQWLPNSTIFSRHQQDIIAYQLSPSQFLLWWDFFIWIHIQKNLYCTFQESLKNVALIAILAILPHHLDWLRYCRPMIIKVSLYHTEFIKQYQTQSIHNRSHSHTMPLHLRMYVYMHTYLCNLICLKLSW